MILFFDTETTGLPDFRAPSHAENQPHLVQLAAILVDPETQAERSAVSLIVKPNGWMIPAKIAAIHGINDQIATTCGVPEECATTTFIALRACASMMVAHNIRFDARIMRIAMLRLGMTRDKVEAMEEVPSFCTMDAATPILNMPPTGRMMAAGFTKPKPPKLAECIQYWFSESHDKAHNALADVRACARIYFHMKSLETVVA